jgi:rhamnosyl/mannosyltransferase
MQNQPIWRARSWMAPASCDIGDVNALRQFTQLARDHDIIHYHFPWPFADVMHFATRVRAKTVMTYHSDIVKQSVLSRVYMPFMWKMLASMDQIVATSPEYAASSRILSDGRIGSRLRVIPLGIQDIFPNDVLPPQPAEDKDPYFLFVGALRYYKGLPTLLKAAKDVSARIIIAGEGACGHALRRMAREMECSNVEFKGQVTDEEKFRLLKDCKAFVLPSDQRSEAFGVALIEAAMFGRPMISTQLQTGTSFANKHMMTGFVVPPREPSALSNAMNTILKDKDLSRKFGANARIHYKNLLSEIPLGHSYNTLYKEILEKKTLTPAA